MEMGFSQNSYSPTQWLYGNVNNGGQPYWASMLSGGASPLAWSLQGNSLGGGMAWLASRCFLGPFQSELKVQRLAGNLTLTVASGGTDTLTSHTWNKDSGTDSQSWSTIAAALAYAPKDLNGFTLTVNCSGMASAQNFSFGGFFNGQVVLNSPKLGTVTIRQCSDVQINTATITGPVTVVDCRSDIDGDVSGSGRVLIHGEVATVELTASACTGSALRAEHCKYIGYAMDADSCTATPVELFNVEFSEIVGDGVTGSNASAPFGVSLSGGGKHILTGADIAGIDDLDVDGYTVTWDELSVQNYESNGTFAYWSSDSWAKTGSLRVLRYASENFTANVGGGQGGATVLTSEVSIITNCANEGDSCRFPDASDVGGTGFGTCGEVRNTADNPSALFPPSGKNIIMNGIDFGADNYVYIIPGDSVFWTINSDGNYIVTRIGDPVRSSIYGAWSPHITLMLPILTADNHGAPSSLDVTMPDPFGNARLLFRVLSAQYVKFTMPTGKTVLFDTLESATAGYIRSNQRGAVIELQAAPDDNLWLVTRSVGAWSVDS